MAILPPTSSKEAAEFFDQLEKVSLLVRYRLAGTFDASPYGRPAYSASPLPSLPRSTDGMPAGVVVHYTASPSLASTVAWFCNPSLNSQRAAHLVISQGVETVLSASELQMYPMVSQLPALPVICRPVKRAGIHATWANGAFLGLELVNLGCDTAGSTARSRQTQKAANRTWECYSQPQVETAAYVVGALRMLAPRLGMDTVLGHEHVQSALTPGVLEDKRDPGPLFPWAQFRRLCRVPGDDQVGQISDAAPPWQMAMSLLGYGDTIPTDAAVRIFQYMVGLAVDGRVGPKTECALLTRLEDRMAKPKGIKMQDVPPWWRFQRALALA